MLLEVRGVDQHDLLVFANRERLVTLLIDALGARPDTIPTDLRRVTWRDSFTQPSTGIAAHAVLSLSGSPSRRSRATVIGSVPSFFSMMQVSQTVWRLFTQGPLSRMKLPPRSSANDTWSGW
jgi:hypothetical protein